MHGTRALRSQASKEAAQIEFARALTNHAYNAGRASEYSPEDQWKKQGPKIDLAQNVASMASGWDVILP